MNADLIFLLVLVGTAAYAIVVYEVRRHRRIRREREYTERLARAAVEEQLVESEQPYGHSLVQQVSEDAEVLFNCLWALWIRAMLCESDPVERTRRTLVQFRDEGKGG